MEDDGKVTCICGRDYMIDDQDCWVCQGEAARGGSSLADEMRSLQQAAAEMRAAENAEWEQWSAAQSNPNAEPVRYPETNARWGRKGRK